MRRGSGVLGPEKDSSSTFVMRSVFSSLSVLSSAAAAVVGISSHTLLRPERGRRVALKVVGHRGLGKWRGWSVRESRRRSGIYASPGWEAMHKWTRARSYKVIQSSEWYYCRVAAPTL